MLRFFSNFGSLINWDRVKDFDSLLANFSMITNFFLPLLGLQQNNFPVCVKIPGELQNQIFLRLCNILYRATAQIC